MRKTVLLGATVLLQDAAQEPRTSKPTARPRVSLVVETTRPRRSERTPTVLGSHRLVTWTLEER